MREEGKRYAKGKEEPPLVEKEEVLKRSVYKGKNHWAARASTYRMIVPLGKRGESR